MESENYDRERAFWRANGTLPPADPAFVDLWPTESRGDGNVRKNNARDGSAQGKGALLRKAPCRLCGWPNDLVRVDHSGGSIDGNGAGGAITTSTQTANTSGATRTGGVVTHSENVGTQVASNGAGCALCFSKNNTLRRLAVEPTADPWERLPPLGF